MDTDSEDAAIVRDFVPRGKRARLPGGARKQVARLKSKVARMEEVTDEMTQARKKFFKGKSLRFLSTKGGFSLVIRRIVSNTGARAILSALQVDLHRTSMYRWEVLFHSSLIAAWRCWYKEMEADLWLLRAGPGRPGPVYRFAAHVVRGDATNSRNSKKIHSMEVKSFYPTQDVHPDTTSTSQEFSDTIDSRVGMANMFEVKGGSAMDTHALYLKHLKSVGCPAWSSYSDNSLEETAPIIIITYFLGSDGGSDEVGAKTKAIYLGT